MAWLSIKKTVPSNSSRNCDWIGSINVRESNELTKPNIGQNDENKNRITVDEPYKIHIVSAGFTT